mgnify:CR=1 FL=1
MVINNSRKFVYKKGNIQFRHIEYFPTLCVGISFVIDE